MKLYQMYGGTVVDLEAIVAIQPITEKRHPEYGIIMCGFNVIFKLANGPVWIEFGTVSKYASDIAIEARNQLLKEWQAL